MANRRDSFVATGTGGALSGNGVSSLVGVLSGITTATVSLDISFDGGTNFEVYQSFTADGAVNIPGFPAGAVARWNVSAWTAGTIIAGLACGK